MPALRNCCKASSLLPPTNTWYCTPLALLFCLFSTTLRVATWFQPLMKFFKRWYASSGKVICALQLWAFLGKAAVSITLLPPLLLPPASGRRWMTGATTREPDVVPAFCAGIGLPLASVPSHWNETSPAALAGTLSWVTLTPLASVMSMVTVPLPGAATVPLAPPAHWRAAPATTRRRPARRPRPAS